MYTNHFVPIVFPLLACLLMAGGCSKNEMVKPISSETPAVQATPLTPAVSEDSEEDMAVSTWAGSMDAGWEDGANEFAGFLKPYGLCEGPDGGLLIVDSYANQLRASCDGIVSTLAGNEDIISVNGYPSVGYFNGNALDALLNRPRFATSTPEGYVIFSDTGNHSIRILKDGVVTLLAGCQIPGFKNGSYNNAQFNTPSGVAVGADGTIYVADTLNHCIRQISPQGQVSTLAGIPGQAGFMDGTPSEALFCEPNDIQLGADGALYVVDKGNQRVRRIEHDKVDTVAGSGTTVDSATGYIVGGYENGPTLKSQFLYPTGLFIADDGTIFLADTGNHCIRKISVQGDVTTVAGSKMPGNENGSESSARFNQPLDVYLEENTLYVSDSYNHVIRSIQLSASKGGSS